MTAESFNAIRKTEVLPSGRPVRYPELHPLNPDMIKGMRAKAEQDRYHGATWETITLLCDEVELLQKRIEELESSDQIRKGQHSQ